MRGIDERSGLEHQNALAIPRRSARSSASTPPPMPEPTMMISKSFRGPMYCRNSRSCAALEAETKFA